MNAQRSNIQSTKRKEEHKYHLYNAFIPTPRWKSPTLISNDAESANRVPPEQAPILVPTTAPNIVPDTDQPSSTPTDIPYRDKIDVAPIQEKGNERTHYFYAACATITGQISTDQTGQFPIPSTSGMKYLMILYDYDSNYIAAEPIPSRTQFQLLKAYQNLVKKLQFRGMKPKLQRLDDKTGVDYQLTPAGLHRRNAAEKAVQTFKNHFVSGLCTTDPEFPMNLWDKLVPQAEITLNLLRASRINLSLSAYAQIHGMFDFNRTPLVPPGLKVLSHVRTDDRKSWDPHAQQGFYIGPALHHYRCHRVWITKTAAERIAQTVKWLPHKGLKMPIPSVSDLIHAALTDLTSTLQSTNINNIVPPTNTQLHQSLMKLKEIFTPQSPQSNTTNESPVRNPITTSNLPTVAPQPRVTTHSPSVAPQSRVAATYPISTSKTQLQTVHQPRVTPSLQPTPLQKPIQNTVVIRSQRKRQKNQRVYGKEYINHICNAVLNKTTGQLQEYRELLLGPDRDIWFDSMSRELARLSHGRKKNDVTPTHAINWKHPKELPNGKKPTYIQFVQIIAHKNNNGIE